MVDVTAKNELNVEVDPLTPEELKWIKRLERTLKSCPSNRLILQTIGDPQLTVLDGEITKKYDLETWDGKAHENGVALADIYSSMPIWGVSG